TTVDEAIEKTTQTIAKTKELEKGLMQRLFIEGIGHTRFKSTTIGKIPEEWELVKLGSLFDFINGHAFYTDGYSDEGYRVVDLLNITLDGKFQLTTKDKLVSQEVYNRCSKVHLCEDDIIIIMTDITPDKKLLGKSAIVDKSETYVLNQRVGCLRRKNKTIDVEFASYAINSEIIHKLFFSYALGTAQFYVNTPTIKNIEIMFPPLPEQRKITKIISEVDAKIEKESNHKEQLASLKKGLMQVLLTGKLRVAA
ncbi:restriction endonuclease subunit S, partial [bacterium]|nr:restriction endonuclease subunit S [bacterium]